MKTLKPLAASEITQPGAYEWRDAKGNFYVGFIRNTSRGRMEGSFVGEDGSSRTTPILYSDEQFCEGEFYGPLELNSAGVAQTIFKGTHLPQPGNKVRFKKDIIATFDGRPDEVWARKDEVGKIIGTERPGNLELFWVESSLRSCFQLYMKDFEVTG